MAKKTKDTDRGGVAMAQSAAGCAHPDHASISALAYQLWLARGCPIGSDLEDWFLAESMLKSQHEQEQYRSE